MNTTTASLRVTARQSETGYTQETMRQRQMRLMKNNLQKTFLEKEGEGRAQSETQQSISRPVSCVAKDHRLLKMVVDEANSRGMAITTLMDTNEEKEYQAYNPYANAKKAKGKHSLLTAPYKQHLDSQRARSALSSFQVGKRYYSKRIKPVELAQSHYDQEQNSMYARGVYGKLERQRPNFYMDHRKFEQFRSSQDRRRAA